MTAPAHINARSSPRATFKDSRFVSHRSAPESATTAPAQRRLTFLLRLWSFPTKGALEDYATAEVKLVWENGEWRLADSSVIDGPYPVARFSARPTLASTATRFEETLAGFNDEDLIA